jgi:hypothetical protein
MRRRTREVVVALSALVLAATSLLAVEAQSTGPRLWIEPAQLELQPTESFQVQVMIADVENLGGFQLEIAYDPTVLEVTGGSTGDFLTSTGRTKIPVGFQVDNQEGSVLIAAATFGDAPGASGSGMLATITGDARSAGTTALRLENIQVLDPAAGAISVQAEGGEVIVGEVSPSPTDTVASATPSTAAVPSPPPSTPFPRGFFQPNPADKLDGPDRTIRRSWFVAAVVLAALGAAALALGQRASGPGEGP